jgi:ribonucleoside-diphosphate reductase alpha chain
MAKEGSTVGGLMDSLGTAISMGLQYGVPLEAYVKKFSHMRFEPNGYTKNADIRIAKSVVDYIVRWLGITFLPGYREATIGEKAGPPDNSSGGEGDDAPGQSTPAAKKAGGLTAGAGAPKAAVSSVQSSGTANGAANGSHGAGTNGAGSIGTAKPAKVEAKTDVAKANDARLLRAGVAPKTFDLKVLGGAQTERSEQFAGFQSDAPSCDNCGSICVRAGNCYLCHNCGASLGCS